MKKNDPWGHITIRRQWSSSKTTLVLVIIWCSAVSTGGGQLSSILLGGTRQRSVAAAAASAQQRDGGDDHLHTRHPAAAAATPAWTIKRTWLSSLSSSSSNDVCKEEDVNVKTRLEAAEHQLQSFLKSSSSSSCSSGHGQKEEEEEQYEFYIHGWRWHTMSLIREASRLSKTAQKLIEAQAAVADNKTNFVGVNKKDNDCDWIEATDFIKAADYVINFNMRGLHKIEKTLFFPWARQRIISQLTAEVASHHHQQQQQQQQEEVATAFGIIMNHLEIQRATVEQLGVQLNGLLSFSSSSSLNNNNDKNVTTTTRLQLHNVLDRVASTSNAIVQHTQKMLDMEESLLVPIVARLVPASEQKSFNQKVIWNLGVLDSRLHLVGMHQAVYCDVNHDDKKMKKKEQDLFQECIPSIPQRMIPRWKRLMYDPQVTIFQRILHDE